MTTFVSSRLPQIMLDGRERTILPLPDCHLKVLRDCLVSENQLYFVLFSLLLHKSGTIYLLILESHHHLTLSNVASKLNALRRYNNHHLATLPHL